MWPKANFDQFPNLISSKFEKQIASCESTGRELSFEWSTDVGPQTQKLESPYKTLSNTLAVTG